MGVLLRQVRRALKPAAGPSAIRKHFRVRITGAAPGIMSAERWGTSPVRVVSSPARMDFFARRTIQDNQGKDYQPRVSFSAMR